MNKKIFTSAFVLEEICFFSAMFFAIMNMAVDDTFWDWALTGLWMIFLIAGFILIVLDIWITKKNRKLFEKMLREEERQEAEQ